MNPDEPYLVRLIVRPDGTYDYLYAAGLNDESVMNLLRDVADQIEHGHTLGNPQIPNLGGPQ